MGKSRRTRQFAQVKRIINLRDDRKKTDSAKKIKQAPKKDAEEETKYVPQVPSSLFFLYNNALGPPYRILIDTNFINFSIQNKLDIFKSSMDCLLGKVIPCISECVMGELEKLG
jgi:U3 small nucleolar RNA-associated protein 24